MSPKRIFPMELISKDSTRMNTFRKRKANLLKKASELSLLCGVDVCVVIFGPNQKADKPVKAETWPANPGEVRRIIRKYKDRGQPTSCYGISDYFAAKKNKLLVELTKLRNKIREAKYPAWDDRLNSFSADQLKVILDRLVAKIEIADAKLSTFRENQHMGASSSGVQASSQLSRKTSCGMENYVTALDTDLLHRNNNNGYSTDLQFFSDVSSLNVQPPLRFQPEQSVQLTPSNPNPSAVQLSIPFQPQHRFYMNSMDTDLLGRNNYNGYSTDMKLFADTNPFNAQLPLYFQSEQRTPLHPNSMHDAFMKLSDQDISNQFNCNPTTTSSSSINQYMLCNEVNGLPYFYNPTTLTLENMWFNNTNSSMSYIAPALQPNMPYMQYPVPNFSDQMQYSELNGSSGNMAFERKDQNHK